MEKRKFSGKDFDSAVEEAKIAIQETEENLIIRQIGETKGGLFKGKKVEIEVVEKREVVEYIKSFLIDLLKDLGFNPKIEIKNKKEVPTYIIYSDNDALLIGKNGKNLKALSMVVAAHIKKELGESFKFLIDVNDYKERHQQIIERMAKKLAREVAATKVEVKMERMNSFERRIVHNTLTNNKKVYTESEGEEPNRYVVIKPKEDK
ncbi:MAG: hypothetical protein IJH18_02550 [Bacilli bacterium]|nr:hypothetical protein [Bacilli bacterium]